jgi:hypothetical protein
LPCRRVAEKLSREKSSRINGLREYFGFMTGISRDGALCCALVDFQCRANRASLHD